jgi:hypothetical protein
MQAGRMKARFGFARRARRGVTLTEIIVVATLLSVIGGSITLLLMRQQRFHRAVVSVTDARARMRDIATILPTDMRGVSTADIDVLAYGVNSLQFRGFVGTSILCKYAAATVIDLPPQDMASKTVLTSWINPPEVGDVAFVYDEGTERGNVDDTWKRFTVSAVASSTNATWCPSNNSVPYTAAADDAKLRYRITLNAAPVDTQSKVGSVIRFAREVRYSGYQATDGQWYVGYQLCTTNIASDSPGACGTAEILAGPIKPVTTDTTTSGLYFTYKDQNGNLLSADADKSKIARIGVGMRTASQSLRQATATTRTTIAGGDSLRFTIGIRNRI